MKIQTPSHFESLQCSPFWALSSEDEKNLKTHFMKLTRQFHPDLLDIDASDEEREEAESKSSAINAAYLKLRDTTARCDYILNEIEKQKPEEFSIKEKVKLPMELSMAYFEIQEEFDGNTPTESGRKALNEFRSELLEASKTESMKLAEAMHSLEGRLEIVTSEHPSLEWEINQEALEKVAAIRGLQKYLERILIDIMKFQ